MTPGLGQVVYLLGLHDNLQRDQMLALCRCFGDVRSAQLARSAEGQYGVIRFALAADARKCLLSLQGCKMDGRALRARSLAEGRGEGSPKRRRLTREPPEVEPRLTDGHSPDSSCSRLVVPWETDTRSRTRKEGGRRSTNSKGSRQRKRHTAVEAEAPTAKRQRGDDDSLDDLLPDLPPLPSPGLAMSVEEREAIAINVPLPDTDQSGDEEIPEGPLPPDSH
eukprot:Hpha_TRINITY_DN19822_c0_g1::TRINITY_DN19822_c0_g1_i1::g.132090::m.132090